MGHKLGEFAPTRIFKKHGGVRKAAAAGPVGAKPGAAPAPAAGAAAAAPAGKK